MSGALHLPLVWVLLAAAAAPPSAAPTAEGVPAPDAASGADGSITGDSAAVRGAVGGARAAPPAETARDALDPLRRDISALKRLLDGRAPDNFRALFEVELTDEDAVRERVIQLESQTATWSRELRAGADSDLSDGIAEKRALEWARDRLRLSWLRMAEARRLALLGMEAPRSSGNVAVGQGRFLPGGPKRSDHRLARFREQLDRERAAAEARVGEDRALREALIAALEGDVLTTSEADARYDEIAALLTERRARLRAALSRRRGPSDLPAVAGRPDLVAEVAALRVAERVARWDRVVEAAFDVRALNDLRLALLDQVSPRKRRALLGLSRTGISQLLREVDDLRLGGTIYLQQRLRQLRTLSFGASDIFTWGTVGTTLFQLLLLLWAGAFVRKRYRGWLKRLRAWGVDRARGQGFPVAGGWLMLLSGVAGPVLWLLFVYCFFWVMGGQRLQEVALLRSLVLAHAWYLVCLAAAHRYITQAVSMGRRTLSEETSERILRSIRMAVRYGFFVVVILIVSAATLGRGYLYYLVVQFSWLGALPIFLILLSRWRGEIETAYLNGFPEGRFVDLVERSQTKRRGLWVVAVVLVFVLGRSLRLYAQDTLSRFKHTRRAFAFILRRQMEKQAETVGRPTERVEALPAPLRSAFAEGPVEPRFALARFPHLDELRGHLARWEAGGAGTAVALVGETGTGRTSWLDQLCRQEPDLELVRAQIDTRVDTEAELCAMVCRLLDMPATMKTEDLIQGLRAGPRRFICLDHCENLVLRSVGGMQAYKAFSDIVGRTVPHLFWLCSFSRYAWEYVESVLLTRNVFRELYRLVPWDADTMERAIAVRMQAAGFEASFEDLILDRAEGAELDNEILRTEERYRQLLWDYTEGVPRLVLHYWLRSLVVDGEGSVKVRLFEAPSADALESLGEQSRFMLAALVIHQNLTVTESAKVLNYRPHVCEMLLGHLRDRGFIEERSGRFRVVAHWYRAVIRYLRRKHLLYS